MPTNHGSIHTSTRGHRQEHVAFLPLDYSKNTQNLGPFSLSQPSAILNREYFHVFNLSLRASDPPTEFTGKMDWENSKCIWEMRKRDKGTWSDCPARHDKTILSSSDVRLLSQCFILSSNVGYVDEKQEILKETKALAES